MAPQLGQDFAQLEIPGAYRHYYQWLLAFEWLTPLIENGTPSSHRIHRRGSSANGNAHLRRSGVGLSTVILDQLKGSLRASAKLFEFIMERPRREFGPKPPV